MVDDVLTIVEERFDSRSGVLYLKLKHDKGWVFDHIPGVGIMCERLEAPPVAPQPVEVTDQASGQVEEFAVGVSSGVAQPTSVGPGKGEVEVQASERGASVVASPE